MEAEGWGEYRKLIISTLERLDNAIKALERELNLLRQDGHTQVAQVRADLVKLEIEFGMQKVRVALIGIVAGIVTSSIVGAIVSYIVKGH